ncbi:MAG: hypothetical protein PHZ03_04110 [Syntrophomonas sp.]|nr:hypothetical protein [Syntrophomonas sp.]
MEQYSCLLWNQGISERIKRLEDDAKPRKTDSEIKTEIEKLMSGEPIGKLQGMAKAKRNEILKMIKANDAHR